MEVYNEFERTLYDSLVYEDGVVPTPATVDAAQAPLRSNL